MHRKASGGRDVWCSPDHSGIYGMGPEEGEGRIGQVEMHDEIFQFEIFKKKNISRPLFEIFHETFNFQY